jgi:predicted negative regulator of RcsB-dependent stress response
VTAERVRTLLLRGDNLLKKERPDRALQAFEEAREAALAEDVAPEVRELVERRIEALRQIAGGDA